MKTSRNIDSQFRAISDVANSLIKNDLRRSKNHYIQIDGRSSLKQTALYNQVLNIFKEANIEVTQLNSLFEQDTKDFLEKLNKEVDDVQQTQCNVVTKSIQIYKDHEKDLINILRQYKSQSNKAQKTIDEYNNCLNDPKLLYNPKEKQDKWDKIEKEYYILNEKENTFFNILELLQTNKKALGINLQELKARNQKCIIEIIKIFMLYLLKSSSSFTMFFFFYSTYLSDKIQKYNNQEWIPNIIPPPHTYSAKSLPFESQNKYPNFMYTQQNLTDQQLVEYSDYAKIYINDIEKQSIQKQEEVNQALKFLESLNGYLVGCVKGLKDMIQKYDFKVIESVQYLMGNETINEINLLMNNIEIAAGQVEQHSLIVQAHYEKVKHHLLNLQECHLRVFNGLRKSLFDHNRIKEQFRSVLMYQSQYQYPAYTNSYSETQSLQSLDSRILSQKALTQYPTEQPNFQIIRNKIINSIPALQDCMIFFLKDYEKTFTKEINSVRNGLNRVVIQIEKSCRDMISQMEKSEQHQIKSNNNIQSSENIIVGQNMNKLNERSLSKYIKQLLINDEGFKPIYFDLNQEIEQLQLDFKKEYYFNHDQINNLQPPSKSYTNILSQTRCDTQEMILTNDSFLSFSEDQKTADQEFFEDSDDQIFKSNEKNNQQYNYMSSNSQINNESSDSDAADQESPQIEPNENQKSLNKKKDLLEHEEFIKKRITWNPNEELKHHFSCAFVQNINLQGRIYITNQKLIFQSYFNGHNLFFNETILEIPKDDILEIHKKKNLLSFDNAIQIDVVKGNKIKNFMYLFKLFSNRFVNYQKSSLLFTQFIYRNDAYDAILKVLQPKNMVKQEKNQSTRSFSLEKFDPNDEKYKQQIEQRLQNIEQSIESYDCFQYELIDTTLKGENITIKDIYQACFSDLPYTNTKTNKEYKNFFYYYVENHLKCWDIEIEKWSPPPPSYFLDQSDSMSEDEAKMRENVQEWIEISQRQMKYEKSIPLSIIPFLPKSCHVLEKQKLIFTSPEELIFELEGFASGPPFADTFYHAVRNRFVQVDQNTVSHKIYLDVRFIKRYWFSGIIQSQSQKEGLRLSTDMVECFQERLEEFLKQKSEKMRSSGNSMSSDNNNMKQSNGNREKKILKNLEPEDKYIHNNINMEFNDPNNQLKVSDVFRVTFDDSKGFKGLSNLYEYLKVKKFNDTNYTATQFSPKIPSFIYSKNEKISNQTPEFSEREVKYTHPLPKNNIPFMPKECQITEKQKVYWVSENKIIINIEAFTSGIPKGDSFSVKLRYIFTQKDSNTVMLQQKFYVNFIKSTYFQGQIEDNTKEQQQKSGEIIKQFFSEVVQNYIQNNKSNNADSDSNSNCNSGQNSNSISSSNSIQSPVQESNLRKSNQQQQHINRSENKRSRTETQGSIAESKGGTEKRKNKILQSLEPEEKFKNTVIDHTFNFKNQPINFDNYPYNEYPNFDEYVKKEKSGDTEYTCTKFSPPIPKEEELNSAPDFSERQSNYTHPLPSSNIPFMPKTCKIKEVVKVYCLSNDMIIVDQEAFMTGIPKSDTFTVKIRAIFKQIDENNINFKQKTYVNFIKNTMLSGKIESNTIEQQKVVSEQTILPSYKDAFNNYMQQQTPKRLNQKSKTHANDQHFESNKSDKYKEMESPNDFSLNQSPHSNVRSKTYVQSSSNTKIKEENKVHYRKSNQNEIKEYHTQNIQIKQDDNNQLSQIQQLNDTITQMNKRFKMIITALVVGYICTMLFMMIQK